VENDDFERAHIARYLWARLFSALTELRVVCRRGKRVSWHSLLTASVDPSNRPPHQRNALPPAAAAAGAISHRLAKTIRRRRLDF